MTRELSRLSKS